MFAHTPIIAAIIEQCNYNSYLELGIQTGINFSKIANLNNIQRATAVDCDPVPLVSEGKIEVITCTTDAFFKSTTQQYDAIFIDADHRFESVQRDFDNALNVLTDYGTIFLHDTDPREAVLLQPGLCDDAYKINDYLVQRGDLQVLSLPVHIEGLTIVRRKKYRYEQHI